MFESFMPKMNSAAPRSKNIFGSNNFAAGDSFSPQFQPKFESGGFKSPNGFSSMFAPNSSMDNTPMAPPMMPQQSPMMNGSPMRAMMPSRGIWNPRMPGMSPMLTNTDTGQTTDLSQNQGGGFNFARIPSNKGVRY